MPSFNKHKARIVERALAYERDLIARNASTYRSWRAMHARCYNPTHLLYRYYGGRGIKVLPPYHDFETFLRDMGQRREGTTLDRIDNDGDYGPGNCRWADPSTQAKNKRPAYTVTPRPPRKVVDKHRGENVPRTREELKVLLKKSIKRGRPPKPKRKIKIGTNHWKYTGK